MKYIIIPASKLLEVSRETLDFFHLSPRYSTDRTQVIMKIDNYEKLFPSIMTLPNAEEEHLGPVYPYPVVEGETLDNLLDSPEWTGKEALSISQIV